MKEKSLTAIYLCKLTNGHLHSLNLGDLKIFAKEKLGIQNVWEEEDIPLLDPMKMAQIIQQFKIERIILAGITPGFAKTFFNRAFCLAGKDPANINLASFGNIKFPDTDAKSYAQAVLTAAFFQVDLDEFLGKDMLSLNPQTLVIGGGIAGIQASLEIADGNQKVFLVEKTGTIGGHMAMFDKTFPTLDCAACILTPKMVDVGQHPNIDLLTYSEVIDIQGKAGDYTVSVLKKARRVDISTCIGCGTCSEKCPSKTPSEFDSNTSLRKAIYIPFPQAVPNKYLIDAEHCIYVQDNGKCGVCVKVCPVTNCIDLDAKDEVLEIKVGQIILATGFEVFDASRLDQYAYGKLPNVITSLELERLVNASGPTEGYITTRTKDKKGNWVFLPKNPVPNSFALIHCIGSRDENYNKYCSKVCCMYTLKLAHLIKEKLPDATVDEYFIDMRAFGKGYDEFYERIKGENINMIRGRTATIESDGEELKLRSEDMLNDRILERNYDMVVLSVGLEAGKDNQKLSDLTEVALDENGWFQELDMLSSTENTTKAGVFLAGLCQGPKDIPDTVAQASSAASNVLQNIHNEKMQNHITNKTYENIIEQILKNTEKTEVKL